MKKFVTIFVCTLLCVCTLSVLAADRDEEGRKLIRAPKTGSPPTLDGVMSAGEWDDAASERVTTETGFLAHGLQIVDDEEDSSYTFWVKYDDEFLYLAIAVTDEKYVSENYGENVSDNPRVWENDAAEWFFDGDISRSESKNDGTTGGQVLIGLGTEPSNSYFVSAYTYDDLLLDDFAWKTTVNESTANWVQEVQMPMFWIGEPTTNPIVPPEPGQNPIIGFDVNIDDSDVFNPATREDGAPAADPTTRDSQLYWEAFGFDEGSILDTSIPVQNREDLWGTLEFLPEGAPIHSWDLY